MANKDEGKIYVDQTHLTLEADCESSLVDAATVILKYIKPISKATGTWTNNITITDSALGLIERKGFDIGDLDEAGNWIIWGHATYSDGSYAAGEPDYLMVHAEGT